MTPHPPALRARGRVSHRSVVLVAVLHGVGLALLAVWLLTSDQRWPVLAAAGGAWLLGARHAFDADHIAMIDNTARKFVHERGRASEAGVAFAAGHSTVVLAAGSAVVLGLPWIQTVLAADSPLAARLGLIGSSVAAVYLLLVAAANLPRVVEAARRLRSRHPHDAAPPSVGGPVSRALGVPLAKVTRPWHVYLVGIGFGIGFDTASTMALLMLTVDRATPGSPVHGAMMALPLLFAAAMTAGDAANSTVMSHVYTSADRRVRNRFNLALLVLTVSSALVLVVVTSLNLVRAIGLARTAEIDTEYWGFALAAAMLGLGALAVGVARPPGRSGPSGSRRPARGLPW